MIHALGEHPNAFCREAPQKCVSTFIDGRNIENEMHCFTVLNGLLATALQHFDTCRRDLAGNCDTCSLFAEFFVYSKHSLASAPRFPILIRIGMSWLALAAFAYTLGIRRGKGRMLACSNKGRRAMILPEVLTVRTARRDCP